MDSGPERPTPGPVELGLRSLWDRHRRGWRRLCSPQLVAELRLRAQFDLELLSPWEIARKIPAGTIPDCERCTNSCCVGLENLVSLRLVDVASLIDLGRTDLIQAKKPHFPPEMVELRPHLATLAESTLFRTLPVLRQVGARRACAALGADRRCTIHPRWPTSCERFPYSLSAARRTVEWGQRCEFQQQSPEQRARSDQLFLAALSAYNERIKDAVLLHHALPELHRLGLGAFLTAPDADPFEPAPPLPIIGGG